MRWEARLFAVCTWHDPSYACYDLCVHAAKPKSRKTTATTRSTPFSTFVHKQSSDRYFERTHLFSSLVMAKSAGTPRMLQVSSLRCLSSTTLSTRPSSDSADSSVTNESSATVRSFLELRGRVANVEK